jgi:uncharacterized protein (UPF0332 family)
MELADEALADARAAKDRGSGRNCLNRAYYAAFYAASALLTARDLHSSKHHGVLSLFDREFVLKDLMSREHGRALHRLFELRSDADYEIFGDFSSDEIDWAVVAAAALLSDARERLDEILKEK